MHKLRPAWSLRHQLVAMTLFVGGATLVAGGAAMYRADQIADEHMLDARLVELAHMLLVFAEHEIEEAFAEGGADAVQETDEVFARRYHYQIMSLDGRLLLRSENAPADALMRPISERGFGNSVVDGEDVRTYTEESRKGTMVMVIGERVRDRKGAVGDVTRNFLAFLITPLLLIAACIWNLLNRTLHSVEGYTSQLRGVDPFAIKKLNAGSAPSEFKPLIDSINELFGRFSGILSTERKFTAFAAHEMRTPLITLRARAQAALDFADSPKELMISLNGLMTGIDRTSYLMDRLLDLARIESLAPRDRIADPLVDLQHLYRSVMYDLGPVAAAREISMKTRFEIAEVPAAEFALQLLLHNLVANAVRFTPVGGRVEISSIMRGGATLLAVDDTGPGIAPSRYLEAFQRFNRLGCVDMHGVGLGLSIVQEVALRHQGVVCLSRSPLGGLRVEVHLPSVRRK